MKNACCYTAFPTDDYRQTNIAQPALRAIGDISSLYNFDGQGMCRWIQNQS